MYQGQRLQLPVQNRSQPAGDNKRRLWVSDMRAAIYAGDSESGRGVYLARLVRSVGPYSILYVPSSFDPPIFAITLRFGNRPGNDGWCQWFVDVDLASMQRVQQGM